MSNRLRSAIPYIILVTITTPIIMGYIWLFISSISTRTFGLRAEGLTLENWRFLLEPIRSRPSIWQVLLSTLAFAVPVAILDVLISSMAGYALSRSSSPEGGPCCP